MLSACSGEKNDPSTVQATISRGKSTVTGTTIYSQSEQVALKLITNQATLTFSQHAVTWHYIFFLRCAIIGRAFNIISACWSSFFSH